MKKLTAREERIRVLLDWYKDALETMDRSGDLSYGGAPGSVCLLMSDMWRHPSYVELERVLREFRSAKPYLWWHVRERFITNTPRTVLRCPYPACGEVKEVAAKHFVNREDGTRHVTLNHRHAGSNVFFVLALEPVLSKAIDDGLVDDGIRWVAAAFRGEPFVPKEIMNQEKAAA